MKGGGDYECISIIDANDFVWYINCSINYCNKTGKVAHPHKESYFSLSFHYDRPLGAEVVPNRVLAHPVISIIHHLPIIIHKTAQNAS